MNRAPDYRIRQGDYGVTLTTRAKNKDGSDVALPGGTTAVFRLVHQQTGDVITGLATASGASLSLTFANGQTDKPGLYDLVFVCTFLAGGIETFPTCSEPRTSFVVEVCPKV